MTLQSPRPFTEFVGFDANNDGNPVTDRVDGSGRNTYEGDYLRAWDLRVSRTMHFSRERFQLQLIADAFNSLNRPNVDEVFSVYGTYDFCSGMVPKHYKDSVSVAMQNFAVAGCPLGGPPVPNNLFGTPRTMFNPRQFQLAAKFLF